MKILNLSLYTWASGGPAHVIHDNTKIQLSMGHEVDILCPYNDGDEFYPLPEGAVLIPFKANWLSKIYPDFSFGIYRFITANLHRYDVVHIHGLWNFPGLVALLSSNKKIAKIVTVHGTIGDGAMRKGWFKKKLFWWLIQGRALKRADLIQVHNQTEKKDLSKLFGKFIHKNIVLITNGLDFDALGELPPAGTFRKKMGIGDEKKIILFFGRLTFKKGIDLLMPAFHEISKKNEQAVLLVVGPDYGMLEYINSYVEKHLLGDRVVVYGMAIGDEKRHILADSDIFTLPTYSESFSIATLEACAAGLPIVVSDEIGFGFEINESKIGVLIDLNVPSLVSGLQKLLDDESLRVECGRQGRDMVAKKYDLKIVTTELVKTMEQLVIQKSEKSLMALLQ